MSEPSPTSNGTPQPQPPGAGRPGWFARGGGWTSVVAAVIGALVAVVVTVGIQTLARGSVPKVPLPGNNTTTITEDTAAANVTQNAGPAVVSVLTGDPAAPGASGFLVSSDGYVVTNLGVLANATHLAVEVGNDPHVHDARLVDTDCQTGLAVLKVDVTGQPVLSFADSSTVRPGQNAILLGGAQPTRSTVTRGVVSAVGGQVTAANLAPASGDQQLSGLIQTDAGVTPVLNGGPLMNSGGQVVGVLTQAVVGGQAAGFALPANALQPDVQQLVTGGHLVVPSLGVRELEVTPEQAVLQGGAPGSKITAITPGGPAEKAGLKVGDVLTKLDDQSISLTSPLPELLRAKFRADQHVVASYTRGGQAGQVPLVLTGEHPTCS